MGYKKKKRKIVFFVAVCSFVIVAHSVNLPHLSYFSGQGSRQQAGDRRQGAGSAVNTWEKTTMTDSVD